MNGNPAEVSLPLTVTDEAQPLPRTGTDLVVARLFAAAMFISLGMLFLGRRRAAASAAASYPER